MKVALVVTMESRVREVASRVAETTGLELVLTEMGRAAGRIVIRLTIDREGGVTLDDCAAFSRRVGAALEAEDPISSPYNLEVSSPGLDRRLVRESDYERFRGRLARVNLTDAVSGQRNFQGRLGGLDGTSLVLELEGGRIVRLPLSAVEKARLVPEF